MATTASTKVAVDDIEILLEDNNVRSAMGLPETEVRYPASTSSVASLNKHMRELEVRYHRTRLNLERATQKTESVQKEIRRLRVDKQQLEKDLHKKSALVHKKLAEAQAIANRDYAKRIEQTVAMGTRGHSALATSEAQVAKGMEQIQSLQTTCDNLADEKRMLLGYVQEQAEKLLQAQAAVQQLHASHKQAIDALHVQLQTHVERIENANASAVTNQAAHDKLLQAYHITQDALVHERSGGEALRKLVQDKTSAVEHLHRELHAMRDDTQKWQSLAQNLERTCASLSADASELNDTIQTLQHRVVELEASVAAHASRADALNATMAKAAADMDALAQERNEAARSMNEAVTISATAIEEQQAMAATVAAQQHQLDQLKQSKQLLQNAMLEQLAAVRKQLQMERIGRLTAESRQRGGGSGSATLSSPIHLQDENVASQRSFNVDAIQPRDVALHVPQPHLQSPLPHLLPTLSSFSSPTSAHEALTLLDLAGSSVVETS
ncbi:hypothetical protein DYB25_002701 [Aphanomyces astaci]|uniref:Uncharacterized protein n=1 Tax=Aphanomyces astaci TaxID=112090 RepID=A0A397A095_APHAT|nr:hypothetical protein DYB36_011528 [Aphanomyces astaci]RHY17811.1 hypothetical protein DYB25_002701 [Aphanomyces astaci]RHY36548.1 hypothetical protein DYB38_002942 [Aphanomyces astaci]RHY43505.1 hypothetical protein DYB34_000324 [Aphanomyces astaci]RHY47721.1 hypothetical protein DYB30_011684 [Aphanomyces astaci]